MTRCSAAASLVAESGWSDCPDASPSRKKAVGALWSNGECPPRVGRDNNAISIRIVHVRDDCDYHIEADFFDRMGRMAELLDSIETNASHLPT